MAGKSHHGFGTAYEERTKGETRKTRYRAEKWVTLSIGGAKRIIARGTTKEEAFRKLAEKEQKLLNANPAADRLTLSNYIDQWLEHMRPNVKPRTLEEYTQVLSKAKASIGHVALSNLTPMHAQRVINAEAAQGKHASANNLRRYLKQALRQAERWELIDKNPLRNIEPVKRPPIKRGIWEPEHVARFLDAARGTQYYALFYTALMTGMRIGELMVLEWKHVNPTHILIRQTYVRQPKDQKEVGAPASTSRDSTRLIGTPKTAAGNRDIPLSPDLARVLESQREQTGQNRFVFATSAGTIPTNIRREFKSIIERAEVPDIRFHDLRRTAATYWARKGFTPKVIQHLLGHSTPHVALAVYTDVLNEQMRSAYLTEGDLTGGENGGKPTESDK